jgi:hypothetical protein
MLIRVIAFSAAVLAAPAALADPGKLLAAPGAWTVRYYQNNVTNGQPMCMMLAKPEPKISFMVKYIRSTGAFVHISKTSWTLPKGGIAAVILTINTTPWTAIAKDIGAKGALAGKALFWSLKPDEATEFIDALRTAGTMTVHFPQGSEPAWSLNTNGIGEATEAFSQCMARLGDREVKEAGKEVIKETQPYAEPNYETPKTVPVQKFRRDSI